MDLLNKRGDIMEQRCLRMIFNKTGYWKTPTTKICIPISWCYKMGLSEDNREVYVTFDELSNSIVITPYEQNIFQGQ